MKRGHTKRALMWTWDLVSNHTSALALSSNKGPTGSRDATDKGCYGQEQRSTALCAQVFRSPKTALKNKAHYTAGVANVLE